VSVPAAVRPHLASFETEAFVRPVHRLIWHPTPAPLLAGGSEHSAARPVTGRCLLVMGDDVALVVAVAAALRSAGAVVEQATPGHEPAAGSWDGIVDLNVIGSAYDVDGCGAAWPDALGRTTRMVQRRYTEWAEEVRSDHCCYLAVTAMGGLMGYRDSGAGQPLGGIWAGFAKCLPRELPNLAVKVVDLDDLRPALVAAAVVAELAVWDLFEIGYRDGVRHALTARRSRIGPTRLDLGRDDVVLISGGARGVGFALARGLAERSGCQVVVTGRSPLPEHEPWYAADREPTAAVLAAELAAARSSAEIKDIRHRRRRQAELRDVKTNLDAASAAGLRIVYEPCDITDPAQVSALFARVPAPAVVVHNAGIDEPKRLDQKSPAEVIATIAVKVTGFANLIREIQADPTRRAALKVFCNVGSLAGRMGGMIGQIDYAAGNEALARLGFWARDGLGLPVQTMCWPTWERLGVIANYEAAVRYVSTIAPDDAVARWSAEIAAAHTDEVMFIGQVGAALVPNQLRGFWLFTGHPDLPRLHALAHFLGRVEVFEPFRRIRSTRTYRAGTDPCLTEFEVDGAPALPVSVVVEQACAVADWVVPPGWPVQHLTELRNLTVHLARLRLTPSEDVDFTTEAVGSLQPDGWTVHVTIAAAAGLVASVSLVYQSEPWAIVGEVEPPKALPAGESPTSPSLRTAPALSWSGIVVGPIRWRGSLTAQSQAELPTVTAADLWTVPFPPSHGIAPAAIEAVTAVETATGRAASELHLARIAVCPGAQHVTTLYRPHPSAPWSGFHNDRPVLQVTP
jgi:NAD(P)-dependent dehydrogenase (short-subunit alcohol dehydrogenase family)